MNFHGIIESIKETLRQDENFSTVLIEDRFKNTDMLYPMNKVMITVGLEDVVIKKYIDVAEDGTESERRMMAMSVGFDIFMPKRSTPNFASLLLRDLLQILFNDFTPCKFETMKSEKTTYDSDCGAYRLSFTATTKEVAY